MITKYTMPPEVKDILHREIGRAEELRRSSKVIAREFEIMQRNLDALKRQKQKIDDERAILTVPQLASRYGVTKYAVRSLVA